MKTETNKTSTNWSTATLNPFKAFRNLVSCLRNGNNAWIERQVNGKQAFPLLEDNPDLSDIAYWKSNGASFCNDWASRKEEILNNDKLHETAKLLMIEYTTAYGTEEEYQNYLKTGVVKFRGMGKSYFIKYQDLVDTRKAEGNELNEDSRFVLNVTPIERYKQVSKTDRKVYVIVMNYENKPLPTWLKIINVATYPLRLIPSHSVLRMDEYNVHTFRVGAVMNGYSIEIHIPKKFSFK